MILQVSFCKVSLCREECHLQVIQNYLPAFPGIGEAPVFDFYRRKNDKNYILKERCMSKRSETDCQGRSIPTSCLVIFRERLDKCVKNYFGKNVAAVGQTDELQELFKSQVTFLFLFPLFSLVPTFSLLGKNRLKKCCLITYFLNTVEFQQSYTNKVIFHITKLPNICLGF